MRTLIALSILLALGCSQRHPANSQQPTGPTEISGRISGTLKIDDSPFLVTGDLLVDSLQTLIIDPGVRLDFAEKAELVVRGRLLANGTTTRVIIFTAAQVSWEGIRFLNHRLRSTVQFALIEKVLLPADGPRPYGAVEIDSADVVVSNTIFRDNKTDLGGGMACLKTTTRIANCIFLRNFGRTFGGGLLLIDSNVDMINCTFVENGSDNAGGGIGSIRSTGNIQNNIFYRNYARVGDPRVAIIFEPLRQPALLYNFIDANLNPRFVSDNDFHLSLNSPCINNGNPDPAYNDADGTRNDQGAYGGPQGKW